MKSTFAHGLGLLGCSLAGLGLLVPATVQAQGQPPVPPAPTREEIQRDRLDQRLQTRGEAVDVVDGIERASCPLANPEFADLSFMLSEAKFTGLAPLDPAMLRSAWANYVGREIPVAAVCEIRDRAGTILREAGYLAAVQVPVQTIENGVVSFDVVLARLGAVQVRGDAGRSEGALRRYIERLQAQPVFNVDEAERYLLLARDIPGLDVRLTLRPAPRSEGTDAGEVVGVFDVVRTPLYADFNIQNYGSRSVGRFGGLARVAFTGLTGMGDETVLSFYATPEFKEQLVVQGSHEFRVGGEGLTFGIGGTHAWTTPDIPGPDAFESRTLVANVYTRYPLIRRQETSLFVTGGFNYIDQETDFSGLPFTNEEMRIGYVRLDASLIDTDSALGRGGFSGLEPQYSVLGSLELRQGFDIFGASEPCGPAFVNCTGAGVVPLARFDGDPTATVVRGDLRLDYRPVQKLTASLVQRFQYSGDPLLSYEQFSGGNYTVGRGYDPGAVIGDSGYGAQFELAYGSVYPQRPGGIALQPYAFVDHVGTWTNNVSGDPQHLTSVGGGVRGTLGRRVAMDLTGAIPLERPPLATRRGDARILLSINVRLAP